ncbi:BadF/BadG/BcrA/BcrD ATPase family protein [Longimicrobium sp.]|jgi:glucosamine kinase|uniref:BadF/BadG/BcrA/BcrD ATPase family protein n=1 Tax=Longimicrobium sp. TaxID=2029185 RepID=UPI002ED7B73F
MDETFFAGVDGGGTRTTLVLADADGRELARAEGPAGLVDPRHPERSAEVIAGLVREAVGGLGPGRVPDALCAGLAGVGNEAERVAVEEALAELGVAGRVRVASDGEIALEGAFGGGAGILLIAGTGSVAYGRAGDGRMERCGGWGMIVGDEGSGYALGREGLKAALRSVDGREPPTPLLARFLDTLGLEHAREIPPWAGRVEKADVAALAREVLEAAALGDAVSMRVVRAQAAELAGHVGALASRLAPWPGEVPVVFHGGVLQNELFASLVSGHLGDTGHTCRVRPPQADAVHGALAYARALVHS